VGEAGISSPWSHSIGIAIDSLDPPFVAYTVGNALNRATRKHLNAAKTRWEIVGRAGFRAREATEISLAINRSSVPYMAYGDGGDSFRPTVYKNPFVP
jgi:hypothetical protein